MAAGIELNRVCLSVCMPASLRLLLQLHLQLSREQRAASSGQRAAGSDQQRPSSQQQLQTTGSRQWRSRRMRVFQVNQTAEQARFCSSSGGGGRHTSEPASKRVVSAQWKTSVKVNDQ
ncbi:unnamed protein product [Ceratitis capitata]|uniref:(Mediterranean fruit fly) hypothetical protein n=1 Tax=Ceratitis capitata TaxID=7213 RepID=A0A811U6H9_CERCA|nr:unnamed protein product [Ceratitis capitata]